MIGKILIIDDEPYIRKGLTKLIEKQSEYWTVIGEATNGKSGINEIERLKPDLVFVDICMPIMNGIDVVKTIHDQEWDISSIILTGHKDFEYARLAVNYGVKEFLLKPCPEEEIFKVLQTMHKRLCKKNAEQLIDKRFYYEAAIRSIFFRLPIDEKITNPLKEKLIGTRLTFLQYLVQSDVAKEIYLLQFAIRGIVEELAASQLLSGYLVAIKYNAFAMLSYPEKSELQMIQQDSFIESLILTIKNQLGIDLEISVKGKVDSLDDLPNSYEDFDSNNHNHKHDLVFFESQNQALETNVFLQKNVQILSDSLMRFVYEGQIQQLKQYIEARFVALNEKKFSDAKYQSFALGLSLHTIKNRIFQINLSEAFNSLELDIFNRIADNKDLYEWINKQVKEFFVLLEEWFADKNQNTIPKAIQYIHNHYHESCSLEEVSSHVFLTPNYFSSLFKRETSVSFTTYLTNTKMNKAKVLLINTDMKVSEISKELGYDDPNYFTTVFRKIHKMSPKQYRRSNIKTDD